MQVIDLTTALELAQTGFAHHALGPRVEEGLDRQSFLRRRGNHREVAQAFERQAQRTWDGGCGEGQYIHFGAQRFQGILLAHAEAVLLVD